MLNAVKNLVLYAGVSLFSHVSTDTKQVGTWVVEDEISHYVRNDKDRSLVKRNKGSSSLNAPLTLRETYDA